MTAEHTSRAYIARQTGSDGLGLLAGEVAWQEGRKPLSSFQAGFISGICTILLIAAVVVIGVAVRGMG